MEHYLIFVNSDVEFAEKLEKVKDDCTLLFDGSVIQKHVHLLVKF